MFDGMIVYKQWHKKAGRWYAYLYNPLTKERTTIAWAKYIMCLHLGRMLNPNLETVDHINNDKSDDRLNNLQLLTRLENTQKSAKGRTMVTLVCPKCGKEFTRERRLTHLIKGGRPSHCSRRCGSLGNQSAVR